MDWCKSGFIISDEAWGAVDENWGSDVLESKVLVPVKWWVETEWTWEGVLKVLGTWDDKLAEFSEKGSIRIISGLVKLWVVDGIEKKGICSRKTTWRDT